MKTEKYSYNADQVVKVMYTNWRGETRFRRIVPISVYWGESPHHKPHQWLMKVFDVDKGEERTFAMKDMLNTREQDENQ